MKFAKAVLIWVLIIPLAILNGALREQITEPLLGSSVALPLSGIILSVLIFIMAYLLIPKIGKSKAAEYVLVGVIWFALTNLFDLVMIMVSGNPVSDFFKMFDVTTGNLWSLVVIACLVSPVLAAKLRKFI